MNNTARHNNRSMKWILTMLIIIFILTANVLSVCAGSGEITISGDSNVDPITIESSQQTIDVTFIAKDINDIYAFSITMDYDPGNINIDLIAQGDIFEDYGSAVVKNDIDNEAGHAEFMQTILSADKGTSEEGVLAVIRLTIQDGEYSLADDLNLNIQIADSKPEYVDIYVSSCTITIDTDAENSGSQPTQFPLQTAEIGIVTPGPESGQEFVSAEDQSAEEIIREIEAIEAGSDTGTAGQSAAASPIPAATVSSEPAEALSGEAKNSLLYIILGAVLVGITSGGLFWYLILRKKRAMNKEAD